MRQIRTLPNGIPIIEIRQVEKKDTDIDLCECGEEIEVFISSYPECDYEEHTCSSCGRSWRRKVGEVTK